MIQQKSIGIYCCAMFNIITNGNRTLNFNEKVNLWSLVKYSIHFLKLFTFRYFVTTHLILQLLQVFALLDLFLKVGGDFSGLSDFHLHPFVFDQFFVLKLLDQMNPFEAKKSHFYFLDFHNYVSK